MRYSHLRDDLNRLRATIAYEELNNGMTAYGVTIVSVTEPESRVSAAIGRLKAKCRCNAAKEGNSSEWKQYGGGRAPGDAILNGFFEEVSDRFMKLGQMKSKKIRNKIRELRNGG